MTVKPAKPAPIETDEIDVATAVLESIACQIMAASTGEIELTPGAFVALAQSITAAVDQIKDARIMDAVRAINALNRGAPHHVTIGDPVADAGREIVILVAAIERAEQAEIAVRKVCDSTAAKRLGEGVQALRDRMDALTGMATDRQATSMAGAMLQVMLAYGDAGLIESHVSEDLHPHCALFMRRIERSLYSVLDVLAKASGESAEALGAGYFMAAAGNPHSGRAVFS